MLESRRSSAGDGERHQDGLDGNDCGSGDGEAGARARRGWSRTSRWPRRPGRATSTTPSASSRRGPCPTSATASSRCSGGSCTRCGSDLHVTADGRYMKCAAVVGEVMKSYHPHGDQSIYDALVRMAQPFSLRYPLVEGYGNFGSIDGDPPAAMRYTECRLTPIAAGAAQRAARPDGRLPAELRLDDRGAGWSCPAQFPNLLVNGASGIAVGMATNIPPHNLKEVCKALDRPAGRPRAAAREAHSSHIQGPDFPTGGVILNSPAEIRQIYATGPGVDQAPGDLRARPREAERRPASPRSPTGSRRTPWSPRIGELIGKGQVPQLTNVKDLSTDDVRIALELRPGANARRGDGLPVQEHAAPDQLQRQPDLPAARRPGPRSPSRTGSTSRACCCTSSTSGSRSSPGGSSTSWRTCSGGSTSSKASRSSSTTSTRRSGSSAPATARPTPPRS